MKEDKFLTLLKRHIEKKHNTQTKAAEHWGVSGMFVSYVLDGKRAPNADMLKDLGYERVVKKECVYTKVK